MHYIVIGFEIALGILLFSLLFNLIVGITIAILAKLNRY
jgi:hypothetical protein